MTVQLPVGLLGIWVIISQSYELDFLSWQLHEYLGEVQDEEEGSWKLDSFDDDQIK